MRTVFRSLLLAALAVPGLVAAPGVAPASPARHLGPHQHVLVRVGGTVTTPATYTAADLAALPQTTLTDQRPGSGQHQLTGVPLLALTDAAAPVLPADAKNAALRVSVTVTGHGHRSVAVARGELDPGFGNHLALLVLAQDGRPLRSAPELVFPGDTDRVRTVREVRRVEVSVAPTATSDVPAGDVDVVAGRRTVTLSAARLAALPRQTRTVTFQAQGGTQTHVEQGPTLAAVLRAAHVRPGRRTSVAASATDGYVAAVTPGEATSGGRPLLLSLVEDGTALERPRLVVDGDLRGGRYVTSVTVLIVSGARHR